MRPAHVQERVHLLCTRRALARQRHHTPCRSVKQMSAREFLEGNVTGASRGQSLPLRGHTIRTRNIVHFGANQRTEMGQERTC